MVLHMFPRATALQERSYPSEVSSWTLFFYVLPVLVAQQQLAGLEMAGQPPPCSHAGTADNAAHRGLSPRENAGPCSSNAEAFLRNNYCYGPQLGSKKGSARRTRREVPSQTATEFRGSCPTRLLLLYARSIFQLKTGEMKARQRVW